MPNQSQRRTPAPEHEVSQGASQPETAPGGMPAPDLSALAAAGLEAAADSIGIFLPVSRDGRLADVEIVFLNAAGRRRWFDGAPLEVVLGRRVCDEIPSLRTSVLPILERLVRDGGEVRDRQLVETPAGPRVIDVAASAFGGHVVVAGRDVTADHQEALAHRASEERLRVTIEGVDAMISYRAPGEAMPSISRQAEDILGRSPEELAPYDAWIDLIHPDDLALFHATHQGPDASWDIVYRMRHADGRWVWVADRGRRLGGNPDGGAWGVITDVTASRAVGEQFRAVFEENPEAISLFRPVLDEHGDLADAECLAMNRTARAHYLDGQAPTAAVGVRVCRDLGQVDVLLGPLRETHRTRQPFRGELREARGTDEWWLDISIFPFEDGFAVVGRDITAERAIEARLHHAQRLEALGQLAGGVAHDFNNLLAAMRGYGQFALDALPDGMPAKPDVEEMLRAVDRASALTRQLLMFSRRKTIAPQVIDPVRVIEEAVGMIRRLVGEHIEVVANLTEGLGCILADPGELERAMVNLAVNARDAMPTGGRLVIAATHGALVGRNGQPAPSLRLTVADTGSGMDPATLAHIFEPFFTTKAVGRGTGLGLAAVYGFVQASGGDVQVASEPGVGTTFTIDLPIADAVPVVVDHAGLPMPGGQELVLVVEDDRTVLTITTRTLKAMGYEVASATSGDEALRLIHAGCRPALLLSDVRMPGLQGPQVALAARQLLPGLPVLLISGFADAFDPGQSGLADVRVLQKPFTRDELAAGIRTALAS